MNYANNELHHGKTETRKEKGEGGDTYHVEICFNLGNKQKKLKG